MKNASGNSSVVVIIVIVIIMGMLGLAATSRAINKTNNKTESMKADVESMKADAMTELKAELEKATNKPLKEMDKKISDLHLMLTLSQPDMEKVASDLAVAAAKDNLELFVKYMELRVWDDPDMLVNDNNDTLSLIAAKNWSRDVLSYLIKKGADLNIKNSDGLSARTVIRGVLFQAARKNDLRELKYCMGLEIFTKKDINMQDDEGKTFGHVAVEIVSPNLFSWFTQHGGKTDMPDNSGNTVNAILKKDPKVKMALEADPELEAVAP